jgi:LytR cell envelope-related transcriptional attenuator
MLAEVRRPMRSKLVRRGTTSVALTALVAVAVSCTFGSGESTTATTPSTSPDSTTSSTTSTLPATTTSTLPVTTTSTSTTTTTSTTTIPATTTTTIPLITEGAVIIVANASGVTGAAAKLGQELGALGFHLADATNAAGNEERLEVSKVYFLPAGADVAASIGRVMGDITVTRMPVPVSIRGGPAELGEATVVVMLGKDLAGNTTILSA